jgi:catechol 2,3-dioxygenase-like lactoylglutathione lyase family enzyme
MASKEKPDGPWMASVPVVVSDRNASRDWYTKRLGLELISDEEHWVTVGRRGKGSMLHLCQASDNGDGGIPLEPGPSGIVLVIPGDFETECARLAENGVEFAHKPEKTDWGWYATIRDPDGNEHNLSPAAGKEQYLEPAALDG